MTAPGVTVRAVTDDADLETLARIVARAIPADPTSLEEMRWSDATYPGTQRFLAERDGRAVGAATVGRIWVYPPEHPGYWGTVGVLEADRRQGVGEALLRAISDAAAAAGKTELHVRCVDDGSDAMAFFEHRGFVELERSRIVRLELAGSRPPAVDLPPGIDLTTLADRPELVPGVHAVALETFADIPGGEEPMAAGDLAEFRARDVDRPTIPADGFFVAVDRAADRVVGYASVIVAPSAPTLAYHDMTAVLRAYRGRGIARQLKHATIAWAIRNGLERMETGNDLDNAPMRAVNARLGYRPRPDEVILRGPLFGGMMTS